MGNDSEYWRLLAAGYIMIGGMIVPVKKTTNDH